MNNSLPESIASNKMIQQELLNKVIYKGSLYLQFGDRNNIKLAGEILYSLFPKPKLLFNGTVIEGVNLQLISNGELFVEEHSIGKVHITSLNLKNNREGTKQTIEGEFEYELVRQKELQVEEISFSLINFLNNRGQAIRHQSKIYSGRVEVKLKDYMITIDKVSNAKEVFEKLKKEGGFAITHIGKISRMDGKKLTLAQIEELLENLMWILSFAAGRQVDVNHIFYFSKDKPCITHYRTPLITEWKAPTNWFLKNSNVVLEKVIFSLLNLMEDEYWELQFKLIFSSYFGGLGTSYMEHRIIILQTALEMLSYAYLVEETGKLTENKFHGIYASKKIRTLLNEFNIDTSFEKIPDLKSIKGKYEDGPHLFTSVRNRIAHPKKHSNKLNGDQLYYVWRLGVVYIELIVLAIAKYEGEYKNMLLKPGFARQMTEMVPWAMTEE